MRVVEAAGYGVVIVETVGVGQSEAAVAGMTDLFMLLQLPNAGDELQAIKKGVMELADLVVVNKADLDPAAAARAVARSSRHCICSHAGRATPGRPGDAVERADAAQVAAVWAVAEAFRAAQSASGADLERRRSQGRAWLWERIDAGLRQAFRSHPQVRSGLAETLAAVDDDRLPVSVAARRLLTAFQGSSPVPSDGHG
jgi:LAO/AO transport system kinase